jgi:FkbM family methyltransferase
MAFDSAASLRSETSRTEELLEPLGPAVSLIIPTYNRCALLEAALASVARLVVDDPAMLEVIVVDNNSTDGTSAMVLGLQKLFPFALTYVFEPEPGVSPARNTGIARARGGVLVFMDDDQEIDPAYLTRAIGTFERHDADCVGGWVGYKDVERFPPWLRRLTLRMGQRDLSPVVRRLGPRDGRLAGGNMAIRRAVLDRVGGFRTDIGRIGDLARDGEDIEFQDRLIAAGATVIYDPALRQHHCLRAERLSRRYYLKRAFGVGRAEYRIERGRRTWRFVVAGVPLAVIERAGRYGLRALRPRRLQDGERFDDLCKAVSQMGKAVEAFQLWAKPALIRTAVKALQLYFRWAPKPGKAWVWSHIAEKGFAWRSMALKARTDAGVSMNVRLPDLIQTFIYFFGVWEPLITSHIKRTLKPGDVFIDVGANVGYHSLLAAHCVRKAGRVYAVEASPSIFRALSANIAQNDARHIAAFHCAAGAEFGEISIYLHGDDNLGATTTLAALAQTRGAAVEATVPLKPLPDIVGPETLKRARMIKIDVEGAEWPVVCGFIRLLPEMSADILVEINRTALAAQGLSIADFVAAFTRAGYQPWKIENVYDAAFYIDPPRYALRPLASLDFEQVDVVFRKDLSQH